VNVSTNSVPIFGKTSKEPGIGLPFTVTIMSAKAVAPVEEIVAFNLKVRVDRAGSELDGISRLRLVVPEVRLHDTGVSAVDDRLTDESFTLHTAVATDDCRTTEAFSVSGENGLTFLDTAVTMLTIGSVCACPIRVTVAVDVRVLSYTVTVTNDVVSTDEAVDVSTNRDESVALAIVKLQSEEIVGAVCRHDQLKERPDIEATSRSGS
jgi:hypothetical protein